MSKDLLIFVNPQQRALDIGSKAANIQRLQRLGMRTPRAYVLRWEAHNRYKNNDVAVINTIFDEIDRKLDPQLRYAVRSSANIEDSFEHSFAGQFKTMLDVLGRNNLMQAIWSVWASADTPAVQEYLDKRNGHGDSVRMAVILQEMVRPVVSGVVFSRNPMNGLRETVVEAVRGPGSLLVQDGATPQRWVYRGGTFTSQPDEQDIPLPVIEEVVTKTRAIARRVKRDVDLEWVYDGQQVFWLQMRDITTLRDVQAYSNVISREIMGGIIKPLIWSVNIPLVNGAWIRLISELTGPNQLAPHEMAKSFYYRSYFNMGLLGEFFEELGFPAESLEMASGLAPKGTAKFRYRPGVKVLRLLPRLARFSWEKWTMTGRLAQRLDALEASYRAIDLNAIANLPPEEVLAGIDRLFAITQEAAYYNIILPLLMSAYNAVLRSQFKQIGIDYALIDMQQDTPEFNRFNPGFHINNLRQTFQALSPNQQERVRQSSFVEVMADPETGAFREGLADLMVKFGHLCDNGNDFSTIPWRENGDTILRLVVEDQAQSGKLDELRTVEKIQVESVRMPVWKGWMLRRLYHRTRCYNLYREHISYIYTYGYGLFRCYFLALGAHLVHCGSIDSPTDIFYLEWEQVRRAIRHSEEAGKLRAVIDSHKQAIEKVRHVQLPSIIYGDECPPVEIASTHRLVGVPTSRGYCTGRVKVITGLQDFPKLQPGDILVIPYSDVGWTPLFTKAAGVIAESGGLLSHSSIIAREYGIPAIVSVSGATLLADGTLVHMDGFKGEIIIETAEEATIAQPFPEQTVDISKPGAQVANP